MVAGQAIPFDQLSSADLVVDATYQGGNRGNRGDEPLVKLLGCGNSGGFRMTKGNREFGYALVCLYSTLAERDWPDALDEQTGLFVYYGDNRQPGHLLNDKTKKGNRLLERCFSDIHADPPRRADVPPFLVFTKAGRGRDVVFRGLAVPGASGRTQVDDLVAVWKSDRGSRFQNYRATFTVLAEPVVSRQWIADLQAGNPLSGNCPRTWRKWVETGVYSPLTAPPVRLYRTPEEQTPDAARAALVTRVYDYFKDDPYEFEQCAAELFRLTDQNVVSLDVTRRWADGGRDAIGVYRIGLPGNAVSVEFALEAKCYKPGSGVGVEHTSRLISRLRHRQFGVVVTTSYLATQAYKELADDGHPVLVLAAKDIADVLVTAGHSTPEAVDLWLAAKFPKQTATSSAPVVSLTGTSGSV